MDLVLADRQLDAPMKRRPDAAEILRRRRLVRFSHFRFALDGQ
jgi:hypothetical protein